jgi:lysophospholipase L1-like esterase
MALFAACGSAASDEPTAGTVAGVGEMPAPVASDGSGTPVTSSSSVTTTTVLPSGDTIGSSATGNRVLLIGDSIMASTSSRYSNDMCEALEPLGWQVAVEAESGRFAEFGDQVLDARLADGWDAAVVLLGNNYRGDQQQYFEQMAELAQRLAPRPVVLLTVTEFIENRREVNDAIRFLAAEVDNVRVVDWAARTDPATSEDAERILGGDGLHLSDAGRVALAAEVAAVMGAAPEQPGDCLASEFTDDTAGPVDGSSGSNRTTTTTVPRRPAPTTTSSGTTTTSPDTTVSSTPSSTSSPAASGPATTAPPSPTSTDP